MRAAGHCSAPVPRFGTLILAVLAACAFSLGIAGQVHVPYESLIELRAAYMPDAARTDIMSAPELIPEAVPAPGSDIV